MSDDLNPEVPRQRVAVIGNSYIGALALAYQTYADDPWPHYFGFFGSAGEKFGEIQVEGGALVGVGISSERASNEIGDYDYFVIFADLPAPHHLVEVDGWFRNEGYSRAVRDAQRGDMIRERRAFQLSRRLMAATKAPVMLLWRNISLNDKRLTEETYAWPVRVLRDELYPALLIEPPRAMLDEGFITHAEYHKGSVGLDGTKPEGRPQHDRAHLNAEGGRVLLGHIAHMVSRDYAAR